MKKNNTASPESPIVIFRPYTLEPQLLTLLTGVPREFSFTVPVPLSCLSSCEFCRRIVAVIANEHGNDFQVELTPDDNPNLVRADITRLHDCPPSRRWEAFADGDEDQEPEESWRWLEDEQAEDAEVR